MPASLDVAARLDQGQAAVDTIAEYVWAAHLLGFDHPDLTAHRYQVHDWYTSEDGLDLRALDAECASLAAAADAADRAVRLQDNNFQSLSRAWEGAGARASTDFLARHATSAVQVAAGIRSAAATLTRLRDNLWDAVDVKASAALQIEERVGGQRGSWLAAARTVGTGVGDRSAACELIEAQVKPFVAQDIGGDWLTAMRSAMRAVADAYGQALAALHAEVLPVFGIPGELGPVWAAPIPPPGEFPAASASMPSWPATSAAVPAPMSATPVPLPAPGPSPGAESADPATSAPTSASGFGPGLGGGGGMPGLGGLPGMGSGMGSGLAGAGQQLADLFGGLLGSSADGVPSFDPDPDDGLRDDGADDADPAPEDDPDPDPEDDDRDPEDDEADEPAVPDGELEAPEPQTGSTQTDSTQTDSSQPEAEPPAAQIPVPTPVSPPPTVPGPAAGPLAAPTGGTPCEIAAEELPQVGG